MNLLDFSLQELIVVSWGILAVNTTRVDATRMFTIVLLALVWIMLRRIWREANYA